MREFVILSVFFLLAVFFEPARTRSADPRHGAEAKAAKLDSNSLDAFDDAMREQVGNKNVAGLIGLIARHGKIGYFETFGNRVIENESSMEKDTLFRIYSMTKPMVAVTAMSLWEEGKFKLDDPISVHLPEWKNVTVSDGDSTVPAKSPITPRQLMTHSSGLTYERDGLDMGKNTTLEEFSASLAKRPLKFQPGTDFTYSYSIDILGRYIEALEGKPLDVVMRERLLDRLEMNDTEFWVRDSKDLERVAQVYSRPRKGVLKPAMASSALAAKPARMMGGQGLVSTTSDYARFCQMLLNRGELDGNRVLKPETVEVIFENHLRKIGKVYGLGGIVDGKGGYSWGGAAGTKFWIDSRNDCYAVFMIQSWGYKTPTYGIFRSLARKAINAGGKD